jgi:hypothetical protein
LKSLGAVFRGMDVPVAEAAQGRLAEASDLRTADNEKNVYIFGLDILVHNRIHPRSASGT